jgi:hypothetical protein
MPNHQADPPADQTAANASPPTPDGDASAGDAFSTLPRRRFWRNRPQRPPGIDPWWQRPGETGPEETGSEEAEPEDTGPEG